MTLLRKFVVCFVSFQLVFFSRILCQPTCNCFLPDQQLEERLQQVPQAMDSCIKQLLLSSDPACKANAYDLMAENFYTHRILDSFNFYINKASDAYSKFNCKELPLKHYKLLGSYHQLNANYPEALICYYKIIEQFEHENNLPELAQWNLAISQIFNRMGQSNKGMTFCRKAVSSIEKLPTSSQKADLLAKVASRYLYYYQDNKTTSTLDSVKLYADQVLDIVKLTPNVQAQMSAYVKLQSYFKANKNYSKSLLYNDSSLKLCVHGINDPELAVNYGDRASTLLQMGDKNQAKFYADSCLYYNKKLNIPPLLSNAYSLVFEIEKKSAHFEKALFALEQMKLIDDSLKDADKIALVNELEKKYNQSTNEKKIKQLDQEKKIYGLVIIATALVILILIILRKQQKIKSQQKIMDIEQRLNRSRMNPHFFFNALTSLQSFALRENNGLAMVSNLSKFANIMRETLESSYQDSITVEKEIKFLHEYIDLQQIRYPESFTFNVQIDPNLDIQELLIPTMILQPFIENSIEHGLKENFGHGKIDVSFKLFNQELHIEIIDNGIGIQTIDKHQHHISRATQIISDRFYLLNLKHHQPYKYTIKPAANNRGTCVEIIVPLIYSDETTYYR